MNIRWANTIEISNEEAKFFIDLQKNSLEFSLTEFPGSVERLSDLLSKEALESSTIKLSVRKTGVNIDPLKLPDLTSESIKVSHPNITLE